MQSWALTFYHDSVEVSPTSRSNASNAYFVNTESSPRTASTMWQSELPNIHFFQRQVHHVNFKKWRKKNTRFGRIVQVLRSSITTNTSHATRHSHAFMVPLLFKCCSRACVFDWRKFHFASDIIFPPIVSPTVVFGFVIIAIASAFHFFFTLAVASLASNQHNVFPLPIARCAHSYVCFTPNLPCFAQRKRSTQRQSEREEKKVNVEKKRKINTECAWILCGADARQFACSCATIRITKKQQINTQKKIINCCSDDDTTN